jgi:hypothetical protein
MRPSALRPTRAHAVAREVRRHTATLVCALAALAALLVPALAQAAPDSTALTAFTTAPTARLASLVSGPPVNVSPPTVAGQLVEGQTLTAASGSWSPAATSATYQWQRDTGSGFADISGATATTYTLVAADVDADIRVEVVATNASGSATADATARGPVIAGDPVNTVAPVITGSTVGGRTLAATVGTWFPAGTSYAYQWQRDRGSGFADISGAIGQAYTSVPADVGASLRVKVTATNAFSSASAVSNALGAITTGKPVSTVAPVVSGAAKRGGVLSANAGAWNPAPASYAYQWQADSGSGFADISGATNTSYSVLGTDIGARLRIEVTVTNAFGSTVVDSAATATVVTDPPVNVGTPSISGTAKRTLTLTATPGTWSPAGATFTYRWQRDTGSGFADISGATAAAYTLVAADVDATMRVVVTARNVDGTGTAASAQTATVVAATPASTSAPTITMASRVGETTTANDGAWTPAPTSYAYQWQRRVSGTWADISGATSRSYTLVAADAGNNVRVAVTATNADGDGVGYSAPGPLVVSPPVAPTTIAAPTGTLTDTGTLTINPGVWTPSGTTLTYQWLRCPSGATVIGGCVTIGAGQTYTLVGPDVGHAIGVRVTGQIGGVSTVVNSTLTADVAGRALSVVSKPTISGTVQVAQVVRAVAGAWSVPTQSERWQWQRCAADGTSCVDIPGASRAEYTVAVADKGSALVAHESAGSWGQTATADSDPVVVDDQPLPAAVTLPLVTGGVKRLNNLQVSTGVWTNNPKKYAYQWQRCAADRTGCADINGETRPNHVLNAADVGHTIRATVSASNTEGSVTAAAVPTAVIEAVLPVMSAIAPVTGTMQVGFMVQARSSLWTTTPDTHFTYQWQRCDAAGANCADIVGARLQSYRIQTTDARKRLRVNETATNPDGAVTAATPVTAQILPAAPGITTTGRLTVVGRADVGKTATFTPGKWSAATEITTRVIEFWRCSPRCVSLPTGGAGSYVLTDDDAGALMRASETATGPGGTTVAWAPSWIGPVHSASVATASLSAGGSASLMAKGVVLARATVSAGAAARASAFTARVAAASLTSASAPLRSLRVKLRRARTAGRSRLRAFACVTSPAKTSAAPCTKAVWLTTKATTLKLTAPKGMHVRVVVVRKKR